MAAKDDRAYAFDMLESARLAAGHLEGLTVERFPEDNEAQDAVVLRMAMIDDFAGQLDGAISQPHGKSDKPSCLP